ncbi:DUF4031 domain-containing protein [Spirillospora sp. NPDC047279]|uniref:DUF4031 domain-containing protein n=1 Tax=Spirillospora sp. NPDC047279 TaxID=3155478 RepID=UPI0033F24629
MILIDPPLWPARGRVWSHMVSDVSYDELHTFARGLGLPPRAFERDHYDVPSHLYDQAVVLGAEAVGCQELVARLIRAGLRHRKFTGPVTPPAVHPAAPRGVRPSGA